MSNNVIKIKRGDRAPDKGYLADGELGYDRTNDVLYIGHENDAATSFPNRQDLAQLRTDAMIKSEGGDIDGDLNVKGVLTNAGWTFQMVQSGDKQIFNIVFGGTN